MVGGARLAPFASVYGVIACVAIAPQGGAGQELLERLDRDLRRVEAGRELARSRTLVAGPDGMLYGASPTEARISVLDPTTDSVRTVAMKHAEAASFPLRIGWVGDTLWAVDQRYTALALFDLSFRELLRSLKLRLPGRAREFHSRRMLAVLSGRRLIVETTAPALALAIGNPKFEELPSYVPPPMVPSEPVESLPLWITSMDGTVLDTLLWLPTRHLMGVVFPAGGPKPNRLAMRLIAQPFADNPLMRVDATGRHIIVVDRSADRSPPTYTIHRINGGGDTTLTRSYGYEPVPLRREWIEAAAKERATGLSEDMAEAVGIKRAALFKPESLPPVSEVLVGPNGWIWIRREDLPAAEATIWEIIEPHGDRVGSIELPAGLSVRAVQGMEAWATEVSGEGLSTNLVHIRIHPG